jgi:hypothetical protein
MFIASKIAFKYTIFAIIATAANIGIQDVVIRNYSGQFDVLSSILVGTGVGLLVKYILDKQYIFRFRASSIAHDTQTFFLYAVMGLATTLIFWGFEFGFHYIFETKEMRYFGGVIGLAFGYLTKYYLDTRYVFRTEAE